MISYYFNIKHAKQYGVEESIMLQNFVHWISLNKVNNKNFHNGRTWTFNSVNAFHKLYSFWTPKQIQRILKSLVDQNVLMTGNYNKIKYDQTKWYALVNEDMFLKDIGFDENQDIPSNLPNSKSIYPNGQINFTEPSNQIDQTVEPIPYNKPDSKPYFKTTDAGEVASSSEVLKSQDTEELPKIQHSFLPEEPLSLSLSGERSDDPSCMSRVFSQSSVSQKDGNADLTDECLLVWLESAKLNYPEFTDYESETDNGLGRNRSLLVKCIPKLKECFLEIANIHGKDTTDNTELFLKRFKAFVNFFMQKDAVGQYPCYAIGKAPVIPALYKHLDECTQIYKSFLTKQLQSQ